MLIGRIAEQPEGWLAECEAAGAFTQGKTREDALFMLANCIECLIDTKNFDVTVSELRQEPDGSITVLVKANRVAPLAARVRKYQREMNSRISQSEAAQRCDMSQQSDYAMYEREERVPSIECTQISSPLSPRTSSSS